MITKYLDPVVVEGIIELKNKTDDESKRKILEFKSLLLYRHGLKIIEKTKVLDDTIDNEIVYINTNYKNDLNPDYKFYGESEIPKENLTEDKYIKFYELKEGWEYAYDILYWLKNKKSLLEKTFVNPDLTNREQFEYLTIDQEKVNEFDYDDDSLEYYLFLIENQKH